MFEGLARFIIKRHKLIIAFWVIVFILALPSIRLVKDVIVYEESEVSPLSTSNQVSQQIIDEEFPRLLPESNAIIVVQADNVRTSQMREFMLELENRTWSGNDSGRLKGVTDVLTLQSTYETRVLGPVIRKLAPELDEADDSVNMTAELLYETPSQFYENYTTLERETLSRELAGAREDVFVVPTIFLQEWDRTSGDWRGRTNATKNATMVRTDHDGYVENFTRNWTESYENGLEFASPLERAGYAIHGSAPLAFGIKAQYLGSDREVARYIAESSFSLSNYTNVQSIARGEQYYLNYMAKLKAMVFIADHRDPPLDGVSLLNYSFYMEDYFFPALNGSFWDPDSADLSDLERIEFAIDVSVPKVIIKLDRTETEKEIILDSLDTFSILNWRDASVRHEFMIDSAAKLAKDRYDVDVPTWFLERVYRLGPDATEDGSSALAREIVTAREIDEYPVPIPEQILTSFIDSKNETMLAVVGFSGDSSTKTTQKDLVELKEIVDSLRDSRPEWREYNILITGDTAIDYDMRHSAERDSRLIEPFTAILVILLIALYFRSAVAPWVPLLAVGMAFVMTQGLMYIIGSYMNGIHYSIQLVVFTMIMGAGADYCIIIVSRFREERIMGTSKDEAIRTAVVWAGESITTSGATAMVAFLALAIFSFPLLRIMGLCLSAAIGMMLIVALTLIPSLLYLIGDWVFWPTMGKRWDKYRARMKDKMRLRKGYFFKAAKISLKYSWAIVAACLLVSIPTTYLVMKLDPNYDFLGSMPDVEAKQGVDAMTEGFGAGNILPTYVVVQFYEAIYDPGTGEFNISDLDVCDALADELSAEETVFKVSSSAYNTQSGLRIDETPSWTDQEMNLSLGKSRNTVMLTVVLVDEPTSSGAVRAVRDLEGLCEEFKEGNESLAWAEVYIGGSSFGTANIGDTISEDFPLAVVLVMAGVYVILLFVLGSVLIPLRLMLTILLSISWTLAMALVIFIWWLGIPVLWVLPVLLFVILMGLGMDYDIFLMTRIKEEMVRGRTDEKAIAHAVEYTGGIITICGVIMASAFGTMMISSNGLLREFGFGLSFAILLDAMIVRIFLVPAIMVMLKKWNWWAPFGLQKIHRKP